MIKRIQNSQTDGLNVFRMDAFVVSENKASMHYVGNSEELPLQGFKNIAKLSSRTITKIDLTFCNLSKVHSMFLVHTIEAQFSNLRTLIMDNCHLNDNIRLPYFANLTVLRLVHSL